MPTAKTVRALLVLLLLAPFSLPAWASTGGDYQPYRPPAGSESFSAPLFVVLAYSAIWLVLLLFVVSVYRRQRQLERELARIEAQPGGRS